MFALLASALAAQPVRYQPPADQAARGAADQEAGARLLGEFRQAGIAGDYWLAFELRVLPYQGPEHTIHGEIFGTRTDAGPLTRLHLPGHGRWLFRAGPASAAWQTDEVAPAVPLSPAATREPLAGTDLSIFDLQMPFLYWTDFFYEGVGRVRGRPAHSFVLRPPAAAGGPAAVRVLLDQQFMQLVQADLLNAAGQTEKSITLLDLKKVGEQWLLKSADVRNLLTRDKTRFSVTSAALDQAWPAGTFNPAELAAPPPGVPPEKIERF